MGDDFEGFAGFGDLFPAFEVQDTFAQVETVGTWISGHVADVKIFEFLDVGDWKQIFISKKS